MRHTNAPRRAAPRSAASPAAPGRLVCVSLKVFPSFIDAAQEAIYIPGSSHLSRYLPEQQHVSALRPPVAATRQRRLPLNMCQDEHKPVLFRARDLRVRSREAAHQGVITARQLDSVGRVYSVSKFSSPRCVVMGCFVLHKVVFFYSIVHRSLHLFCDLMFFFLLLIYL